jgi:macrolide-specific efflux system membrane fusion protein
MKFKKFLLFIIIFLVIGIYFTLKIVKRNKNTETIIRLKPQYGVIKSYINATGIVQPRNRLEIKPTISGRIEKIFFKEGDKIKSGQVLALMSSLDRATILDAVKASKEKIDFWEEIYKPIPIVAPINGEIIVKNIEIGQTVSANETLFVISDILIIKAYIDETDIGKIKIGQKAIITLDAYPDNQILGNVSHISYESEIRNNVTMYKVDILPKVVSPFFRSGMSANIDIIETYKTNILVIPLEVLIKTPSGVYVFVEDKKNKNQILKKQIKIGISDEKNVEVISGLDINDIIILKKNNFSIFNEGKIEKTNPFMMTPPRRRMQ